MRSAMNWKLCETCPLCGSLKDHACFPYIVDAAATRAESARRLIPKGDLCDFCQEKRAVADTQPPHASPICAECLAYRAEHYPERTPCVMRQK